MSAAAVAPARIGYAFVPLPQSVADNLWLLTPAELQVLICVQRYGNTDVTLSDKAWETSTRKTARAKEYGTRGLLEKQVLHMEGQGDKARYSVSVRGWNQYAAQARVEEPEVRTVGRGPSKAAAVHAACEGGCALAAGRAVLVAEKALGAAAGGVTPLVTIDEGKGVKSDVAKPVSRTAKDDPWSGLELAWAKTLGVLMACFPLAGVVFLQRLLAVAQPEFGGLTDGELAEAVQAAWLPKRGYQTSPGLFLETVPGVLRMMRARIADLPPPRAATLEDRIEFALVFGEGPDWERHIERAKYEAALLELEREHPKEVAKARARLGSG